MQTVFIYEIQANNDGTAAMPAPIGLTIDSQTDENNAIARFHQVCASAAISACDMHTVKMVDYQGDVYKNCQAFFAHPREAAEE